MKILKSLSDDPLRNFALEKELLERRNGDFVLLYIDAPSVVAGRNQSPQAEADVEWCARNGVPVIRRISGGGAVYHDHGNVNFCFITDRGETLPVDSKPLRPIIDALAEMGVGAEEGERGELRVGGSKVSGTASCVIRSRRMFHGTLLFDADLERMRLALAGNSGLRGKKVASVPSETANLKPLMPGVPDARAFMDRLAGILAGNYGAEEPECVGF